MGACGIPLVSRGCVTSDVDYDHCTKEMRTRQRYDELFDDIKEEYHEVVKDFEKIGAKPWIRRFDDGFEWTKSRYTFAMWTSEFDLLEIEMAPVPTRRLKGSREDFGLLHE